MGDVFGLRVDEDGSEGDGLGCTQKVDHGLHTVDAHIHKAAGCHVTVKDVGVAMRKDVIVARGVLAKADGDASDASNLLKGVLELMVGRVVQRTHRLESYDVRVLGGIEDPLGLAAIGAEGLLYQHVLAGVDERERLGRVAGVGAANVDRVDRGVGGELFHRGVASLATMLLREGACALGVARLRANEGGAVVGVQHLDKVLGDGARSDGCDAKHVAPPVVRRSLFP